MKFWIVWLLLCPILFAVLFECQTYDLPGMKSQQEGRLGAHLPKLKAGQGQAHTAVGRKQAAEGHTLVTHHRQARGAQQAAERRTLSPKSYEEQLKL